MKNLPRLLACLLLFGVPLMAGCDKLGIETAGVVAARKEAESKAIGSACRHAGRAIEDCYALNRTADKAAVFAGWRDMNDYMRDKKIEEVKPTLDAASTSAKSSPGKAGAHKASSDAAGDDDHDEAPAAKPAKKVAKH